MELSQPKAFNLLSLWPNLSPKIRQNLVCALNSWQTPRTYRTSL
jgi:hypothetical protein